MARKTATRSCILTMVAAGLLLAPVAAAQPGDPADPASWSRSRHGPPAVRPPVAAGAPAQLTLDDGSLETGIGFGTTTASQFLWFNRFDPPASDFDLQEIQVLFPPGPEIVPGAAVQLVVYSDPDGDPTTGADLLAAIGATIQVADGATFSVYTVDPAVRLPAGEDVLIGVINRFVDSGTSPTSRPAALDTTAPAGRSWVALWSGDPPDPPNPPLLPPDLFLSTVDFLEPGNWMIRGTGAPAAFEIPALGPFGLAGLAALLGLAGAGLGRRRSTGARGKGGGSQTQ